MRLAAGPPRLAHALLRRALPTDVRESILDDLAEVFDRDCRASGTTRARLRYWRRALSFARLFLIERCRDRRLFGAPKAGWSWLDVKLGFRMLVRYPGLSLVGGLGIAVVVACGTAVAVFDAVVGADLPFEGGDRVVTLENWDTRWRNQEHRILHDFAAWRESLTTVEHVGAYRIVQRNLLVEGRAAEPIRVAEMTAAGFAIPRVPPLLGRHLVSDDEMTGAPAAVVLGYDVWRRRFDGDPAVVGRELQLGDARFTVVGVMPAGFRFPVNEQVWTALRANPADHARRQGPVIFVFARLVPGADLDTAQAELATLGERATLDHPDTHASLQPRVTPYTASFFDDMEGWEIVVLRAALALLLTVVCANIAVLVYARTASRQVEIAVRRALGATRRRIVTQILVEGLLLAGAAAIAGLGIAQLVLRQVDLLLDGFGGVPFWMDISLASGTVAMYVVGLTVLGAAIVGLVPALHATGRRAEAGLQQSGTSLSRWRLGRTFGALIVVQVALAVAILPAAISTAWTSIRYEVANAGFPGESFLTARLVMDRDTPPDADLEAYDRAFGARLQASRMALVRRLESEPGVAKATVLAGVPGFERPERIEVEGEGDGQDRSHEAGVARVGLDFFDAFGVSLLSGRFFDAADVAAAQPVSLRDADGDGVADSTPAGADAGGPSVIVNRSFVRDVMTDGPAVGRRVRLAARAGGASGPWLEIVGVVGDFPAEPLTPGAVVPKLYRPLNAADALAGLLTIRTDGANLGGLADRLRVIATEVDPRLQLHAIRPLGAILDDQKVELGLTAWSVGLVTLSVLLLSAAGLYAVMAFTVAGRRREIGIRVALGATRQRVLGHLVQRALVQLASGIVLGLAVAAVVGLASDGELSGGAGLTLLPFVAAFMLLVGLAAVVGPARRGLRVEPTDALREE